MFESDYLYKTKERESLLVVRLRRDSSRIEKRSFQWHQLIVIHPSFHWTARNVSTTSTALSFIRRKIITCSPNTLRVHDAKTIPFYQLLLPSLPCKRKNRIKFDPQFKRRKPNSIETQPIWYSVDNKSRQAGSSRSTLKRV